MSLLLSYPSKTHDLLLWSEDVVSLHSYKRGVTQVVTDDGRKILVYGTPEECNVLLDWHFAYGDEDRGKPPKPYYKDIGQ